MALELEVTDIPAIKANSFTKPGISAQTIRVNKHPDRAYVIREIDRVRCLVHEVYGVDSPVAMAGLAFYRAAISEYQPAGKAEKETK